MNYVEIIVSICSGLAVCIPLVVSLCKYVSEAKSTKQWDSLLRLIMANMAEAERLYDTGAQRKEYVMGTLTASASAVGYPMDADAVRKISDMIDSICDLTKEINVNGQ